MLDGIIDHHKLMLFAGILLIVSLLVILAIFVDLWDGIYTAKFTGQRIHSHKIRDTFNKLLEYWRYIIIAFLVDCLGCLFSFYVFPFVAIIIGASLIVVEIKSMFEHARRRKSNTQRLPDIIKKIISADSISKAKDVIATIADVMNDSANNDNSNDYINS